VPVFSIDTVVTSEEVGFAKPEGRIFLEALCRLQGTPAAAVFIGDSWSADIVGAFRCGMATLWLNRYGRGCPDPSITVEIQGFEPLAEMMQHLKLNPHVT